MIALSKLSRCFQGVFPSIIASADAPGLPNVAYVTPQGKKVLIVINTAAGAQNFNIRYNGKIVVTNLEPGTVGTFTW